MATITHVVTRPFSEKAPLKAGDQVDATSWPNKVLLEQEGYMRPASQSEIEAAAKAAPSDKDKNQPAGSNKRPS